MVTKKYIKDGIVKNHYEIIIKELGNILEDGTQLYRYHNAKNEEEILNNGWLPYENIDEEKQEKIQQVIEYDKSIDVNSFFIGSIQAWIDRDTRVSLMNSTTILKNAGQETTTLWLNNMPFVISCELLIQMLGMLEIYALQCYNVTEQHKANINNLTNIEEIQNYDFKLNYPEKLTFTI